MRLFWPAMDCVGLDILHIALLEALDDTSAFMPAASHSSRLSQAITESDGMHFTYTQEVYTSASGQTWIKNPSHGDQQI